MAKVTKSKILEAAEKNFDAIEAKLTAGVKKAAGSKVNSADELDASKALADWKKQFQTPSFIGTRFTIPEDVYEAIAQKISDGLDKSFFSDKLSLNEGEQIKKIAAEISKILPTIEEATVPVDENGTTVNYKIDFGWKNVGVITVYKGTSSAILQAKNSTNWNEAVAKYTVALHQLGADTIAYAKKAFRKALISEAATYWKAAFGNATNSEWTKITKNTAFKKISAEYARTLINDFLTNINDDFTKTNLREYGTLAILYKNLADAVGNRQSDTTIQAAAEKFSAAAKKILGSSFIELPEPASDFHYSANLSEVTIPAGVGNKINSDDYETKVKKIYATAYTSKVTINGNANANVIYSGSGADALYGGKGNDTIYGGNGKDSVYGGEGTDKLFGDAGNDTLIGGKGNDCLTGGAGADVFYYESGDGSDVITDYVSGQDKIKIGSGVTVTGYSVKSGKDGVLTIGSGKITLNGVGNSAVTVIDASGATKTYGGIAAGLNFNNSDLAKATAVTINSSASSAPDLSAYSSLVTLNASGRTSAIELIGNAKDNRILGGSGADTLNGGTGKDTLVGGAGADTLIGGKGNDCLTGGAGKDVFYYTKGDGADIIADFTTGDKIYIDGATSVSGSLKNNDVTFKIGSGSVKVTGGKDKEITIAYSNGTLGKYLNGALVSMSRVTNIPSDALPYNGHYYKIYNDGMTWSDAKTFCENLGGHLLTITDANEQTVIENLLYEKGSKNSYWLGGFKDSNNRWKWITGENWSYSNWADSEPNGSGDCLQMYTEQVNTNGRWDDTPTTGSIGISIQQHGLICEWDGVSGYNGYWFVDDNNFSTGADLDSLIETNSVGNISASNSSTNFAQDTAALAENQIDIRAEGTDFSNDERHNRRIAKISALESK
ncbi:MAG: hypothetical protein J5809_02635 [Selenomonadaceae bacterium]|nr:hypothetical protein [Selenomonadaceae bacterium]